QRQGRMALQAEEGKGMTDTTGTTDDHVDYLIVGAAFAGSLLAAEFARLGKTIFTDKFLPGTLMNCGGGLPVKVFEKLDVEIPFRNVSEGIMCINGMEHRFPCNYVVVDRSQLDAALCDKACAAGAVFKKLNYTGHDPAISTAFFIDGRKKKISMTYKKLILAYGLYPHKDPFSGKRRKPWPHGLAQVEILSGESTRPNSFHFDISPGLDPGYAWMFPMPDGRINIGAGSFRNSGLRKTMLSELKNRFDLKGAPLEKGGGVIPLTVTSRLQKGNVIIYGDAAGMVNPLNGEGLMHIAKFADRLVRAVSSGKNINIAWLTSNTFLYLLTASLVLKIINIGSSATRISLYPASCRLVASIRRQLPK
ncbi:MAG: NAD(P)/FAD-dependent oxidoreductase, partial [Victivallales bacterium]|nr:NAD(P)/FAD-dependent oxidoreductase [Victivallales bacterium]